jgi:hypothetical protein
MPIGNLIEPDGVLSPITWGDGDNSKVVSKATSEGSLLGEKLKLDELLGVGLNEGFGVGFRLEVGFGVGLGEEVGFGVGVGLVVGVGLGK